MRSQFLIVESRWAMIKLVRPFIRLSMARWISTSVRVSTELVASSKISTGGSFRKIRAMEILLEEKPPAHSTVIREFESAVLQGKNPEKKPHRPRRVIGPKAVPETQLLSNGDYTLFLTDSGLGFSKCGDLFLTRWRPDPLRGDGGIHLMARLGEETWELTWGAETILYPHKVEFHGRRGPLSTHVETYVCPQLDGEIREITLGNHGEEKLEVELGVFGEVCLATVGEDMAHPAFVRLTVEADQREGLLLFWRRQGGGPKPKGVLYAQLYAEGLHPRYLSLIHI